MVNTAQLQEVKDFVTTIKQRGTTTSHETVQLGVYVGTLLGYQRPEKELGCSRCIRKFYQMLVDWVEQQEQLLALESITVKDILVAGEEAGIELTILTSDRTESTEPVKTTKTKTKK
jgi:hypothetical protein